MGLFDFFRKPQPAHPSARPPGMQGKPSFSKAVTLLFRSDAIIKRQGEVYPRLLLVGPDASATILGSELATLFIRARDEGWRGCADLFKPASGGLNQITIVPGVQVSAQDAREFAAVIQRIFDVPETAPELKPMISDVTKVAASGAFSVNFPA